MEALSNSRIEAAYRERTRRSAELAKEALELFPSGITHDSRKLDPYTIYVDRAEGPRKWDVDGNEYVDYFGGHGRPAARPPPSRDRPRDRRCARPRHPLRIEPRRRGALGAGGQGAGAVRGAGPVHVIGNRSHAPRAPDRPRGHRAAQGGALPHPLPRLARPYGAGVRLALRRHGHPGRPRRGREQRGSARSRRRVRDARDARG